MLQLRVSGLFQERIHATRNGICHRLDIPRLANESRLPFIDQLGDSADIRADDGSAGGVCLHDRVRHVLSTSRTRDGERRPLDIRLQRPTGLIAGELDARCTAQRRRKRLELLSIGSVADDNQAHVLRKVRQGGIEGPQQRVYALLRGKPTEEQEVGVLPVGRICPSIRSAVEDRVVGEVLQEDDLVLGPAALDKLGAHEPRGRDDPVDSLVGLMGPVERSLHRRQRALRTRALHATALDAVAVAPVLDACVADSPVAIEHEIAGADGHVIVGRVENRDLVLPQVRGVENGQRDLPVHVVEVDDIGAELLAEGLEVTLSLWRIDQRHAVARRLERALDVVVLALRHEVPVPLARQVVGMPHGEIGDLVPHALQLGSDGEVIGLRTALTVVELVYEKDPHRPSPP